MSASVIAVDFGASSIRVCRVDLGARPPALEVVHRFRHGPRGDADGHLRWDWPALLSEMEKGLARALEGGPVASIGIDTWGLDYGLLDARGALVAPPFSYRDDRTSDYLAVAERVGVEELYAISGVQLQPFNTIFQVAAHARDELDHARHLVMLPELLVHHLTGVVVGELTSAGTTGLLDVRAREWSPTLAAAAGIDIAMLPPLQAATTPVGTWHGAPVHLVGGHDTASAVVAMAADPAPGAAFVSAGTWLLVGQERDEPDTSPAIRQANFSNELGALGGVRLLKNLAGFWLLEQCRHAWGDPPVGELLDAAAQVPAGPTVDVTETRFLNPPDMPAEIADAAGLPRDTSPATLVRCILESMAAGSATVLDQLGSVSEVRVFGGGAQADLYVRCLAERVGVPVHVGPVEATALGNALVQGISLGVYADLADARAHLAG